MTAMRSSHAPGQIQFTYTHYTCSEAAISQGVVQSLPAAMKLAKIHALASSRRIAYRPKAYCVSKLGSIPSRDRKIHSPGSVSTILLQEMALLSTPWLPIVYIKPSVIPVVGSLHSTVSLPFVDTW
jgi:hypothetical protein